MTFKELIANIDYETVIQMSDTSDAMDAFERHIRNGVHEAVSYRMHSLIGGVLADRWQDLFLTLHHLVTADPDADRQEDAVFGTVLADVNADVGLEVSRFLTDHAEELTSIVTKAVDETIDTYKSFPFSPASAFFRRFNRCLPALTPELERLDSLAYDRGRTESPDPNRMEIRTNNLEVVAEGEETLESARVGIPIETALKDDEARESFLVAAVALIEASATEDEIYSDIDGEAVLAGVLAEYFPEDPDDLAAILTEELDEPLTEVLKRISAGGTAALHTVYGDADIWIYAITNDDEGRIWVTAELSEDDEDI